MESMQLTKDPFNIIITGVGGQGNVMASRMLANALVGKGYQITIGETFGASQRGGSVMSHIRVSAKSSWSPQIPRGRADVIVALEPIDAIRVLITYGNPCVKVLTNMRAVYPVGVIAGELNYPSREEIKKTIRDISLQTWFLDATEKAVALGNPILGNMIMMGALTGLGVLPVDRGDFEKVMAQSMSGGKLALNMKAFDAGAAQVQNEKG
jgi:indolepyruvate ferredoxin oxidoreductase, beta subunit